jgi:Ligand-gated ion channel.
MRIIPFGMEPYIIISNHTVDDAHTVYKDKSLSSEMLQLFAEKYNITTRVVYPKMSLSVKDTNGVLFGVVENETDFAVGVLPVIFLTVSFMDMSFPLIFEDFETMIPCIPAIPRVERIMSIFSNSTWMSLGLFYVLSGFIFWFISNINKASGSNESNPFRKIAQCFYNVLASLLGVSVPEMPRTQSVRLFFIFYVIYCLAVTVVFQSFFTTFLVKPGYGRLVETFDELFGNNVVYGKIEILELMSSDADFEINFTPKEIVDCGDVTTCVERAIFKGDIALFTGANFPYYLALKLGVRDVSKFVCFGIYKLLTAQLSIGVHK